MSKETRGRKRDPFLKLIAEQVKAWHMTTIDGRFSSFESMVQVSCPNAKYEAHRFRNSTDYKELREEFGDVFTVRVEDVARFVVAYKEDF